jgi:glycosyltransferase
MTADIICVLLSCIIMAAFLIAYIVRFGVPTSISATYYRTDAKWLMPVCTATAGVLTLVPLLKHTPEQYQFVAFFIVASILFVACAPAFREELEGKVHAGAAIVLGLSAVTWLTLTAGVPWLTIAGVAVGLLNRKCFVFWLEVGILSNLYLVLLLTCHNS